MKIVYKAGPCTGPCCPKGDTHSGSLILEKGARITRQGAKVYGEDGKLMDGGAPVEVADAIGEALIKQHPTMFQKAGSVAPPPAKKVVVVKKTDAA